MFKNISLQAKNSLLQLGQKTIKPTCQELSKLRVSRNFLQHELPIRYIHLIKLLSVNGLNPVLTRVMEDVDILQKTAITKPGKDQEIIRKLSKRMGDTLKLVKSMSLDKNLLSQIYTCELSVKLLLEEWEGLEKNDNSLVQILDFVKVAEEAAQKSRKDSQTITVTSSTGKSINNVYIKSHLIFMLSELIKSQSDQSHLNIIVSEGREDVCFRITNDFGTNVSCATKPLFPIHGLGLRPHQDTNFVQSMARYWQGEMETVKMGNLTSTYLHIKKQGAKECIPPVMQSVPHNWIATLLN